VQDVSGGVVPGASLELVQVDTNDRHLAKSGAKGIFTFVNLPIGVYRLLVTKDGYASTSLDQIAVHVSQTTDVLATLKVGNSNESVTVDASASSVLETTASSIGSVIDLKFVEDLPLGGRDLSSLVALTPGLASVPGYSEGGLPLGNFNGQVEMNTTSSVDGVIGSASRGKYYGGNAEPAVTPRVENVQEMSVQTDMMDVDQGYGQASLQVNYVSRSGTNKFHGTVFEDFKNDGLYARSWYNNANDLTKTKVLYNDFGASVGGPILRDKLFFFGNFSERKIPGNSNESATLLTSAAQAGNFGYTYSTASGGTASNTVNLYDLVNAYAATNSVLNTIPNAAVASQLSAISGTYSAGTVTTTATDPNIAYLNWKANNPSTYYYPIARLDYNISPKLRTGLTWSMTQFSQPDANPAYYPTSSFADETTGDSYRNFTLGALIDWEAKPNLINQFRGGFLYNASKYSSGAKPLYDTEPSVAWAIGTSGQSYYLPVTEYYPLFNFADTVSWQLKSHTIKFGGSWYREQDHYWNTPMGIDYQNLAMETGDPALNAFTTAAFPNATNSQISEAENLYATLTGRIGYVTGLYAYSSKTKNYATDHSSYALDEVANAWAWYVQDSWRATPSLTVNYGIRWDYTGDDHDITGAYHSWGSAGVYGPTGVDDLFNPGSLTGTANPTIATTTHAYKPWHRSPQPQLGLAWNPNVESGPFAKLLGGHSTVIRAGFSLKKFTEPQQFIWDYASDYGQFYFQNFYLYPANSPSTGYFTAGSLALGNTLPQVGTSPSSYVQSEKASDLAFEGFPFDGMDPKIPQPYVETWNLGIQRQIGSSRAIELRYQGNHSVHQWVSINSNEVNIFENGFLDEFKHAQANYKINHAAGIESFADNGYSGQYALPILTQSFQGEGSGGNGIGLADFGSTQFINYLQFGQVGTFASTLSGYSGTVPYVCNLIGDNFSPCANNLGATGTGTYPINFWQANPYASGNGGTGYLAAVGYANYDSFQAELRQENWKGLQMNANYAWSHTLGMASQENWTGGGTIYSMRKSMQHANYVPGEYDIRHVIHVTGTYDLPFGKDKHWLSSNDLVSRVAGNWTLGNIITWQTGMPQHITGGFDTYNDFADGGVVLGNGLTRSKLQHAVGVHRLPQSVIEANGKKGVGNFVTMLDPKYLASSTVGGANTSYITPNTTPGTLQAPLYLYGPHGFYHDVSVSKNFPIWSSVKTELQGEFLNVWNHPVFGNGNGFMDGGAQDTQFGAAWYPNNLERHIQVRLNIEF
jgi:hypothetical protein